MYRVFFLFAPVFLALLVFFAGASSARADTSLFTVDDVRVDVTAGNAALAREQAFESAQGIAFATLVERLQAGGSAEDMPPPAPDLLSSMIEDFEILSEQLSDVRYVAQYRFRFKGLAVRDYLSRSGVRFSDVPSRPLLVLPYYQWGGRLVLWSADNPWLEAWKRTEQDRSLVPVAVPIGDLQDMRDISDENPFAYDSRKLDSMRSRYGAGEAVLLIAAPESGPSGHIETLWVHIYRTDGVRPEFVRSLSVRMNENATFERAAREVRTALREDWKQRTAAEPGTRNDLLVRVRFSGLPEWMIYRKAIERTQGVRDVQILSLAPREARIRFFFNGDSARLRLALAQQDLVLGAPRFRFDYGQGSGTPESSVPEYDLTRMRKEVSPPYAQEGF